MLSRSLSQNRYFWDDPSQSAGSNLGKVFCLSRKRGNCAFLSRKLIVGELGLAYMWMNSERSCKQKVLPNSNLDCSMIRSKVFFLFVSENYLFKKGGIYFVDWAPKIFGQSSQSVSFYRVNPHKIIILCKNIICTSIVYQHRLDWSSSRALRLQPSTPSIQQLHRHRLRTSILQPSSSSLSYLSFIFLGYEPKPVRV